MHNAEEAEAGCRIGRGILETAGDTIEKRSARRDVKKGRLYKNRWAVLIIHFFVSGAVEEQGCGKDISCGFLACCFVSGAAAGSVCTCRLECCKQTEISGDAGVGRRSGARRLECPCVGQHCSSDCRTHRGYVIEHECRQRSTPHCGLKTISITDTRETPRNRPNGACTDKGYYRQTGGTPDVLTSTLCTTSHLHVRRSKEKCNHRYNTNCTFGETWDHSCGYVVQNGEPTAGDGIKVAKNRGRRTVLGHGIPQRRRNHFENGDPGASGQACRMPEGQWPGRVVCQWVFGKNRKTEKSSK